MKKLLIGAMVAMLCVSDVNGSFLQTASSKNKVSVELQQEMGNYYRGMIGLANALLIGWADTLSYTAKDSAFKSSKKYLQNAKKKLSAIAKYTRSVLNRDRSNSIKKNESSAAVAAGDFVNLLGALKSTDY